MKLFVPLAFVAGHIATVAAIAVPHPLPPSRDSFPPARVPTIDDTDLPGLQRAGGNIDTAPDSLPGRRIGRLGGYSREEELEGEGVHVVRVVVVSTVTSTELQTVTTTGTITPTALPPPPSTTPSSFSSFSSSFSNSFFSGNSTSSFSSSSSSSSRSCDLRYCDAGTSYCEYWGGYSSFDVSQGRPIPGETRTSIGVCSSRASPGPVDSTTTTSSSSGASSTSSSGSYHYSSRSKSGSSGRSSSYNPLDSITCTSTIKSSASASGASSASRA